METISNAGCNEVEAGNFEDGKRSLSFVVLFYVLVKSVAVAARRLTRILYLYSV